MASDSPFLTVSQIRSAARQHPYLILRHITEGEIAANSKATLGFKNATHHGDKKSQFIGLRPCSMNEYINKKAPFV